MNLSEWEQAVLYLWCVLAECQSDELLGKSLPLVRRQRRELGCIGMSHQSSSVRLGLYINVRSKLQPHHTRMGRLWLGFCWEGGRADRVVESWWVANRFRGRRRRWGAQMRVFAVGRRVKRWRRLKNRRGGVVRPFREGRRVGGRNQAGTDGLAGAVVHLYSLVLLSFFVFLLLFLLNFFNLQLLCVDLCFVFFLWTEKQMKGRSYRRGDS